MVGPAGEKRTPTCEGRCVCLERSSAVLLNPTRALCRCSAPHACFASLQCVGSEENMEIDNKKGLKVRFPKAVPTAYTIPPHISKSVDVAAA